MNDPIDEIGKDSLGEKILWKNLMKMANFEI